ncbi:MAG: hypothetical protein UD936_00540 [Acutalibacteraceae bacterium]|nr:hypothetical protein [Acutalibacteraceae bacterium]
MTDNTKPEFAYISALQNDVVSVNGGMPYVNIPVISPYGIASVIPKGTRVVAVPVGDTAVCIGAQQQADGLKEGELMLFSSGGASIVLKNDGKVLINGKEV